VRFKSPGGPRDRVMQEEGLIFGCNVLKERGYCRGRGEYCYGGEIAL